MAVANEYMNAVFAGTYRPAQNEPIRQHEGVRSITAVRRAVRTGLRRLLEIEPQELPFDVESAGLGQNPEHEGDVVIADFELLHFGTPEAVAEELLNASRPGGRIGIASPAPGSFLEAIHDRIAAYAAPGSNSQRSGFTATREELNRLFGASAIALGARDRSVTISFLSAEHWLAEWQNSYAPLRYAYEHIDPEWRGQFTSDLLRIACEFAEYGDGELLIHCDYLEFVVHTGNAQ